MSSFAAVQAPRHSHSDSGQIHRCCPPSHLKSRCNWRSSIRRWVTGSLQQALCRSLSGRLQCRFLWSCSLPKKSERNIGFAGRAILSAESSINFSLLPTLNRTTNTSLALATRPSLCVAKYVPPLIGQHAVGIADLWSRCGRVIQSISSSGSPLLCRDTAYSR